MLLSKLFDLPRLDLEDVSLQFEIVVNSKSRTLIVLHRRLKKAKLEAATCRQRNRKRMMMMIIREVIP